MTGLLHELFEIKGNIGIELNPEDITPDPIKKLKTAGFNMVSVGVQSFSKELNDNLGRSYTPPDEKIKLVTQSSFEVVGIDLIFGIKEQTQQDIVKDFTKAVDLGATQISTYPFIDFSYSDNLHKHYGERYKRKFINSLLNLSKKLGYRRDSVWTYVKEGTRRYSSVTRDNFIGFGRRRTVHGSFQLEDYIYSI